MSMLFKRIKDWATSITSFRTGDVIAVDGPDGTAKMGCGTLLQITSDNVENNALISDGRVLNGKVVRYKSGNSDIYAAYQKNPDGSFILRKTSSGTIWSSYSNAIIPVNSNKISISFSVAATENNTKSDVNVTVFVSSGGRAFIAGEQVVVKSGIVPPNNVFIEFDPSSHPDWSELNVWISMSGADGKVAEVKISNLQVYGQDGISNFNKFGGTNLHEILHSLDDVVVDGNIMGEDKTNGKNVYLKTGNEDIKNAYQKNADGSFIIRKNSSGTYWSYYNTAIVPNFSYLVRIRFKVEVTANNTNPNVHGAVWVSNGRTSYVTGECENIKSFDKNANEVDVTFDPTYYQIYKDPPWTQFNVWVSVVGASDVVSELKISNLEVYQLEGETLFNNFNGKTAKQIFESIDTTLSGINASDKSVMVAPNGTKYLLSVQNDGSVSTIPAIPSKGVYFGNSLILGSGLYGLAASDDEHDYYYLVNNYITTNLNNSFVASRYSGTAFEGLTNPSNVDSTINTMLQNLAGDEDLVVVQLGDNVNTAEKVSVFENSARQLLQAIRTKCSRARVVWLGLWYSSSAKINIIQYACKNTGCEFVSMAHLDKNAGKSYIGAVQKRVLGNYTLSDVSSVEDVGGGYIHITFSVSGNNYTSEILVNSWSLDGTTLTYNGEYKIIDSSGAASHPGDSGMRDITNLFLYQLGYSSTPNPIS